MGKRTIAVYTRTASQNLHRNRRARMSQDPWFVKTSWSYVPCQWKGFALIFALVAVFLASFGIFKLLAALLGAPWISYLSAASFAVILLVGLRTAERHSRKA